MLILSFDTAKGQQCTSPCDITLTTGSSTQNLNLNSQNLCIVGDISISNMNINGSNNTICVKTGVTLTGTMNLGNVTINVYGTFNFNGNVNSNVIFNIYSGGTLNYQGNGLNSGTINNSGNLIFSNTGQVNVQGATINNNVGGVFTATAPSKVLFNNTNGPFNNYGTATFTEVENSDGSFNNNAGATLIFQKGTFQHGAFHNSGSVVVNCTGVSGTSCESACLRLGNKNAGQFSNDGSLTVHGSMCLDAQVIFHNNGTVTVDGNLNIQSGGQYVQGSGASTTVGGTTTVPNQSTFSGGTLCSTSVSGTTSNTTQSCGTPPTINNITATTCRNTQVTISIPASVASPATISWSSLKIRSGTTTVLATASSPTLTTTNGTYTIAYTSSSASILFVPATSFTGSETIQYQIASQNGSNTTYADEKTITATISPYPTKPTIVISNP